MAVATREIGSLPEGWARASLEELLSPVEGGNPEQFYSGSVTYIDISSVDSEKREVTQPRSIEVADLPSRARRIVEVGDVLFATVRPYRRAIALVPKLPQTVASTGFCVLRAAPAVSARFLYFLVQSERFMEGVLPLQRGVSYPAVSDKDVKNQVVAVPPSKEQMRIVASLDSKLESVDEGVRQTRTALEKSAQLRAQLRDDTFLDSGHSGRDKGPLATTSSELWPTIPLSEILTSASYGTSEKTTPEGTGELVLRIPNVEQGKIRLDSLKYATRPLSVDEESFLRHGDILVVRTNGSLSLVGRSAMIGNDLPPRSYFASYLIRLRVDHSRVEPAWVEAYLATTRARAAIEGGAASTSGQHNIGLRLLRSMNIPLPSIATQRERLSILREHTARIDSEEQVMHRAIDSALEDRRSHIEAAVAGTLVAQDPDEPSAHVLLNQVRMHRSRRQIRSRKVSNRRSAKVGSETMATEAPEGILFILQSSGEWTEAQQVYDRWLGQRQHSTTLVEAFYSELGGLVDAEHVDVQARADDDGRKISDEIRIRQRPTP